MMPRRTDRFPYFVAALAFATAAFVACATKPDASDNASIGTGPSSGDSCATPGHEGCPCAPTGATAQCGKVVQQSGDYVTCEMGTSTCNGSTWGACAGDHVVSQSIAGNSLTTQGLHFQGMTGTCNDACDPYCTQTQNDPTDVDAAGFEATDGGISIVGTVVVPDASVPTCQGLQCNVTTTCSGGGSTTLTGHVYDPAGLRPLYNAYVYVPTDPVAALPALGNGASCDACGSTSLKAVAVAQTDASGAFTMTGVPDGVPFPLVVQVGKWRREVTMPAVAACSTTPVSAANTRLPRNRTDGNGGKADLPHLAIASGGSDPFECLLLKIGIDPAEIDVPSKSPAIDYYVANGKDRYPGGAPTLAALASTTATLNNYDAVILPCEGHEDDANNAYVPNLSAYTDGGGKLFTTHFGYAWLATPTSGTAGNSSEFYGTAAWTQPFETGGYSTHDPMTAYIDQGFPKGVAYAQWLQNVGATSSLGQLTIVNPRHDAQTPLGASQQWMHGWSTINDPSGVGSASAQPEDMMMHMTFNTPVGSATQCGRVVFSDFHVSASDITGDGSCTTDSDCGYGSTCTGGAVTGNCDAEPCKTDSDCGDTNLSCLGATPGSCTVRACTSNGNCSSNSCVSGKCQCTSDADCGGATCTAGVCDTSTSCLKTVDCTNGNIRKCSGAKNGACGKACTISPDCGGTDRCVSNKCFTTCNDDGDCPGASTTCKGVASNTCSTISDSFPFSCVQSPMSAQELALEFMFFDLAACVSDDKFAPPPPPQPVTYYYPATFTEQFSATCAAGQVMKWREVDWQGTVPPGASIDFSAQTGADFTTLNPTSPLLVAHATATTALPNFDVAYIDLADKGGGGAFATATPAVPSQADLVLTITLNPTPDQLMTPSLGAWKVRYDCVDAQ